MADRIYLLDADRTLRALSEAPFETEDTLQKLIATNPELLDGEQISPGAPRLWLLVRREMGVPDAEAVGDRWSIDHLFLDQDAIPTLVEVKRAANSEIRRTIVGQMLDYASNATVYWPADRIRETFEAEARARGDDPAHVLARVISVEDAVPDIEDYWDQVDTNLRAGRLRLLFVADEIPPELQRIVEFLNAQMTTVDVLAVELKQFADEDMRTLVPRVFGVAAAGHHRSGRGTTRTIRRSDFIEGFPPDQRSRIESLLDQALEAGAQFEWGSVGVSVRVGTPAWSQPVTIAWWFPPGRSGWLGLHDLVFGAPLWLESPAIDEVLDRYAESFDGGPGTPVTVEGYVAGRAFHASELESGWSSVIERIRRVVAELKALPPPAD